MALTAVTPWGAETLTYADLNAEFNNIYDNPMSLISPCTATLNLNGNVLSNAIYTHTVQTFTANDATPSVASGTIFKTANTSATTITMLDGGSDGQIVWIIINDANPIFDFTGTNLRGNAGADWSPTTGDSLQAVFINPLRYCRISKNV